MVAVLLIYAAWSLVIGWVLNELPDQLGNDPKWQTAAFIGAWLCVSAVIAALVSLTIWLAGGATC